MMAKPYHVEMIKPKETLIGLTEVGIITVPEIVNIHFDRNGSDSYIKLRLEMDYTFLKTKDHLLAFATALTDLASTMR